MAALVQSYPQQSSTVTMLQTRPSSASGILQNSSQSQSHHQYPTNPSHMQRNSFHGLNNGMGVSNYRGHTAVAPIAPYAFTSTPSLSMPGQRSQSAPHLQAQQRTSSAPIIPTVQHPEASINTPRSRYPAAASVSTTSSSGSSDLSSLSQKSGSRDNSAIIGTARVASVRPLSTIITSAGGSLAPPVVASPVKATPGRYRRPNNPRADSSISSQTSTAQTTSASSASSTMPNVMQFYGSNTQPATTNTNSNFNLHMPQFSRPSSTIAPGVAADDMQLPKLGASEQAKRYRRRSIHTIDVGDFSQGGANSSPGFLQQGSRQVSSASGRIDQQGHPLRSSPIVTLRPASSHGRNGSTESVNSTRSSHHSRPSSVSGVILLFRASDMHLQCSPQSCFT